jgi:site-specific DNA-methyltransferase (adenine-specific)
MTKQEMEINKIYNENCLDTMRRMPDGFIDLTVTSPPYDNLRTYKGYEFDFENIAKELFRVTKKGGVVVWVVGDATVNGSETGTSFKQALYFKEIGFNLHDTMIYGKRNYAPKTHNRYEQEFEYMFIFSIGKPKIFNAILKNNKYKGKNRTSTYRHNGEETMPMHTIGKINDVSIIGNIFYYDVGKNKGGDTLASNHVAIFPELLPKDQIYSWSNEGNLVYDPFMGSGTTAKAAIRLNRNWIGSEISQEYVELSYKRLLPYLTQTKLF